MRTRAKAACAQVAAGVAMFFAGALAGGLDFNDAAWGLGVPDSPRFTAGIAGVGAAIALYGLIALAVCGARKIAAGGQKVYDERRGGINA